MHTVDTPRREMFYWAAVVATFVERPLITQNRSVISDTRIGPGLVS